ncbi:hypothetical protein [Streptomyces sp. NPDC003635]
MEIDWGKLEHAYGSAEDVPALLRAMASEDAEAREEATEELVSSLCHQGTVYPASVHAVPELARLALEGPGHRAELLWLLGGIADGDGRAELRAAARRAVAVALPPLSHLAHDTDARVREAVLLLIAACGQEYALPLLPLLRARLAEEPDPEVRGKVVTALALLDAGDGEWRHALLTDPEPRLRIAAAEDLLRTAELPLPGDLVDVGAGAYAEDPHERYGGYWPVPYTPFTDRLLDDPDAAVRALRQGVPLAFGIVGRWRDREADVLPWLPPELDAWELQDLAQLVRELPPELHARVRDLARTHLTGDPLMRAAAVTALAHARAPEAVEEAVRLIEEDSGAAPGPYGVFRAAVAVAEAFGADALPVALAVARSVSRRPEAISPYLIGLLKRYPEAAAEIVDELAALVPRLEGGYAWNAVSVLGRLGPAGGEAAERALREATAIDHQDLRLRAAVAHHRVSGEPELALSVLRRELAHGESSWPVGHAGKLGPAAAPLLPLVEPFLAPGRAPASRAEGALAVWRITGRTEDTVELIALVLASAERFHPRELDAVKALTEIGLVPRFTVPALRLAAESPRRVAPDLGTGEARHLDYTVRDAARTLLATADVID